MARQSGVSTPIFDQLLREMTEVARPSAPPPPPPAPADPEQTPSTPPNTPPSTSPTPRRRHRAD